MAKNQTQKQTKKPAQPKAQPTAEVLTINKLIAQAGRGAATMVEKTREAAMLAKNELPKTGTAKEKVDAVAKIHADAFAKVDKNVKALFVNLLTLLAAPQTMVEVKPASGKNGPVVKKASEAAETISKNAAASAATAIRRAEGSGRAEKTGTSQTRVTPTVANINEVTQHLNFFDQLQAALKDKGMLRRIKAILQDAGYSLEAVKVEKNVAKKATKKTPVKANPKPVVKRSVADIVDDNGELEAGALSAAETAELGKLARQAAGIELAA